MATYKVKTGHDVALVSLVDLDPHPDPGPGIQATRRTHAIDGAVTDEGRFIELHWSALTTDTVYRSLLTSFGLSASVAKANVTVYVRDETYAFVRMNGVAKRPLVEQDVTWGDRQSRPLDVTILVTQLETAA